MLAKIRARLTYANVVATLALFIALGGSSYAAIKITGKNVKNSSLSGRDIKNNSVTGKDVKGIKSGDVSDHSLLAKDFKAGQLPSGQQGPKGDPGAGVRAYSVVRCLPTDCSLGTGRGVSSVTRTAPGTFCLVAPGISATETPAAVTVIWIGNSNTTAMTSPGCLPNFEVKTFKTPSGGPAEPDDDVGFTILIP